MVWFVIGQQNNTPQCTQTSPHCYLDLRLLVYYFIIIETDLTKEILQVKSFKRRPGKNKPDHQHSPNIFSSPPFNNSAGSSLELKQPAGEARRSRRSRRGVDLPPLACWDCGFESRQIHGCLSLQSVMCCLQLVDQRLRWSRGTVLAFGTQTRPKPLDFSGRTNPQHSFFREGSKAVCPMS